MKAIILPFDLDVPALACGGDLKGSFALAKGRKAFLVEGFGDLSDPDNFDRYEASAKLHEKKLGIKPKIVICDLHPGYFSARFAEKLHKTHSLQLIKVQHHKAHIAAAMVDNGLTGKVIGVAFDGTGFGLDGNIWGGEFFVGDLKKMDRVSHLDYMPMPGGEIAVKEPWRMAASLLYKIYGNDFLRLKIEFVKRLDKKRWAVLKQMIDKKINSPMTSSAGRLFDAVGSMILLKGKAFQEAELPIALEKMAMDGVDDKYKTGIRGVVKDLLLGEDKALIAAKFHNTVADMILQSALKLKKQFKVNRVVLSGGVFQNRFLVKKSTGLLKENGFSIYINSKISTTDSGLPIGQLVLAGGKA